jgi:predicted negative regulator of RcsB-dependent stress response
MASEATETFDTYKLWAWFEINRKQVMLGAAIVVGGGLIAWYVVWQQQVSRTAAEEALSDVAVQGMTTGQHPSSDAYLRLATKYPNSGAGALVQFERFRHEYRDSPLVGQAILGVAASLDAQGKANEAVEAYQDLIRHHPGESLIPQAKLALAQLYIGKNQPDLAAGALADVARDESAGSLASEAALELQQLRMKLPSQGMPFPAPATPPKFTIEKQ